jgi:hypothetical protein
MPSNILEENGKCFYGEELVTSRIKNRLVGNLNLVHLKKQCHCFNFNERSNFLQH